MKKLSAFLLAAFCAAVLMVSSGWGFLVHRTVNQLAVYQLPQEMQAFFYENRAYLVKNAVRPDQRRLYDTSEASRHFMDAELYGDSALWKMPHNWEKAVAKYSKDTLLKNGYGPYWVIAMKERLTNAFRLQNRDSILFYAADLGHYIADQNVPLHTTANYDGQLSGQNGLHSLWEATIPELDISHYQLYTRHKARYLKDPAGAIWRTVQNSFKLVPQVLQQEKEASKGFTDSTKYRFQKRNGKEVRTYTTRFAREYSKRLGKMVNQRLLTSASQIADFWYTAWVDAGQPDLNNLLTQPLTGEQKEAMEKEWKVYKKNKLLQENLLLSKQTKDEDQ